MLKSELIAENKRLKQELDDVCIAHKRLTKILNNKIDEIYKLRTELKNCQRKEN